MSQFAPSGPLRRSLARLNPSHKLRLAAWSCRHVENWPALLWARLASRRLGCLRLRNGPSFSFHTESSEISAILEVFCSRVYDPPVPIPQDGTVADVGANIGAFALYAATAMVPAGRVLAWEPNPACVQTLRRNLAANRLTNVEVHEAAVGVGGGASRLRLDAWGSGNASLFQAGNETTALAVATVEPRAFLQSAGRIDFLKVDCEGGEHPLIWETDASDWRAVHAAVVEYHLGFSTGYPSDADAGLLGARLREFGFRVEQRGDSRQRFGYLRAYRA